MLTSLVYLQQVSVKNSKKLTKILHINEENLHIFRMNWGISMNFSEKVWFMMILKVTKKQGFTLSLSRKDSLEKEQGWGGGGQIDPPSLFRVKSVSLEQMFSYTFAKTILSKMNCLLWDFALRFVSFSQQDRFVLVTHIFSLALIFLSSTQKCMMFSDKNPAKTILEHQFAK